MRPTFSTDDASTGSQTAGGLIPHEIVSRVIIDGVTPVRAWREYLALTPADVAARMGMHLLDFEKLEANETLDRAIYERIAATFGLAADQIDF